MKQLIAIMLLCLVAFTACKKSSDGFPYEGAWRGTYAGADNGTWTATIANDGTFNGSATSALAPTFPLAITGKVSNTGKLTASYNFMNYKVSFDGQLTGNNASGTWKTDTLSLGGTWTGQRQ